MARFRLSSDEVATGQFQGDVWEGWEATDYPSPQQHLQQSAEAYHEQLERERAYYQQRSQGAALYSWEQVQLAQAQ